MGYRRRIAGPPRILPLVALLSILGLVLSSVQATPVGAVDFNGISASAASGTPANAALPSANVGQPIAIAGAGFNLNSEVVFPTIRSQDGATGTRKVKPTWVSADGTSMRVVVPDDAMTGNLSVVGAIGSLLLQVVPTVVDVDLVSGNFVAGSSVLVLGGGFIEGDLTVRFGTTPVLDTGVFTGPDVANASISAGLDRSDNDGITLQVPGGGSPGLITVETDGGTSAALPISVTQLAAVALSGTPANAAQPSANPGQTIRILGGGFDLTTEVVFPTVDASGTLSNRAVLPDLASYDGTLMEVRVPDDAVTGNVQVVGQPLPSGRADIEAGGALCWHRRATAGWGLH